MTGAITSKLPRTYSGRGRNGTPAWRAGFERNRAAASLFPLGAVSVAPGHQPDRPGFRVGLEFLPGKHAAEDPRRRLEFSRDAVESSDAYHAYRPPQDWRLEGRHLTFTTPSPSPYPEK